MTMKKIINWLREFWTVNHRLEDIQQAIGRIEARQLAASGSTDLRANEFKAFSQNGEDGILQYLLRHIPIPNKVFVEFGVHNYKEANTRFLLRNNNWSGLVIDGSKANVDQIKSDVLCLMHGLRAECAFIDASNINDLIRKNGISGDIGLLSVDIDGNDFWVWRAIDVIQPRIVIVEYNSLFGPSCPVSIPYDRAFQASKAHYSGLYWGASISAFTHLGRQKGYRLVGSNSTGNNLFFVREDCIGPIRTLEPQEAWVRALFRISKDLDFDAGRSCIANCSVVDVTTDAESLVRDLS